MITMGRSQRLFSALLLSVLNIVIANPLPSDRFEVSTDKIVDLTYPFDEETLYWPQLDELGFNFTWTPVYDGILPNGVWYQTGKFEAGEHGGTHVDSPSHFFQNGSDAGDLKPEQLMGPAVVINVSAEAAKNLDYQVSLQDIQKFEDQYGKIPEGAFVFMFTDWGKRWPDKDKVFNTDNFYNLSTHHFPGFHPNTTEFLVSQRNIRGLGVDSPSVDSASEGRAAGTHVILGRENRVGIEFVANLEKLPPSGASVIALPMKIARASGSPVRLIGTFSAK